MKVFDDESGDPVDAMDSLISGIISDLSAGHYDHGARGLQELAYSWAKAGLPQNSFENMRKHIIDTSHQNTHQLFHAEHLILAERKLRDERRTIFH